MWRLLSQAQQAMPVIGFVNSQASDGYAEYLRGFRDGLNENGYDRGSLAVIEAFNPTSS